MGVLGVEPRTSSLSGTRSNQLSYTPSFPLKSCLRRRLRRLTLTYVKASGTFRGPRSPFFRAAYAVLKTASKVFFYLIRLSPDSKAYLVEPKGLEPSTSCLQSRCSSQLSYGPGSYLRPFGTLTVFYNDCLISLSLIEL